MKSDFLTGFKSFALKGNAFDMAVGVVIGGAFGKIVSSLVSDIIMPIVGKLVGGINFTSLKLVLSEAGKDANGKDVPEVAIDYGVFIQNTIDFLIIAFSIYVFIVLISKLSFKKKEEAPAPVPPPPTKEEELLTQIRDILQDKKPD